MDYRIEKLDAFRLVCRRKFVNKPQGETATEEISAFWDACNEAGLAERICRYGRFDRLKGLLGVCFSGEMADSGFPYGIGAEYNGAPMEDRELELIDIPAQTYAVFPCRGRMPEAFRRVYHQICTEFFPQSGYRYGNGVELEVYPSADVQNPDYACEIWIAVQENS